MSTEKLNPHFLQNKRIVISGAGVSGLAFAISLHQLWPSVSANPVPHLTIYERDPCAIPPNREGYSLSIRSDGPSAGIQTLQKMGLLDTILQASISSFGGDQVPQEEQGGFVIWDRDFKEVLKFRSKTPKGCLVASMRVARSVLRKILADAAEKLPGVQIVWDTAITSVSSGPDGIIDIVTDTSRKETADILIAADGSSSKLRHLLRPWDPLKFAGPTCIYGTSLLKHSPSRRVDEFGPTLSGNGRSLFFAPVDHKYMVWCLSWHTESPAIPHRQPLPAEKSRKLHDEAREQGEAAFGERFTRIIDDTEPSTLNKFNAMDKTSFAHTGSYINVPSIPSLENLRAKIIFLGDANHAVSPFAGNGANLAMMDSWDLAQSLLQSSSLREALGKYDKLAVGRARQVVRLSHMFIRITHSGAWVMFLWLMVLRVVRWLFFNIV